MKSRAVVSGAGLALLAATLGAPEPAAADPCGMVPPLVIPENQIAIKRVGAQKTFVAHYRGIETMVLRPGFEGKVDEFGMLIPFPSPPAIYKVDDDIFAHIAAAVEPPEVVANVWRGRRRSRRPMSKSASGAGASADRDESLRYNTVRVVNREAVGMYDVAVLEAGSARALKRWMDQHGFRYPKGMDGVTQEYVSAGWFFVAIKTQVGQKDGVNPRPGMRQARAKLPAGSSFDGHVQGMGFRFKSRELVVPMRLSAYNAGKLRNIVYVLTDRPVRIKRIPRRYVKRQISGRRLYRNLTGPLPLRIFGGTFKDLSRWQRKQLVTSRNPERFNGLAKRIIAGDMLAIRKRRLANPVEEKEKELLAIGEALGLRGKSVDALHRAELDKLEGRAERRALRAIRNLHLTVIDGEFDREVLAEDNLTFARYRMPKQRNTKESYDPTRAGPGGRRGGILYRSSIDELERRLGPGADRAASLSPEPAGRGWPAVGSGVGLGVLLIVGLIARRRRAAVLALLLGATAAAPAALADASARARAIAALGDDERAAAALETLVRLGEPAVDDLVDFVVDGRDLAARGWAIVALGRIGGERAGAALEAMHQQAAQPMLIRTWAVAARIEMTESTDELLELAALASQFPAVARPVGLKLAARLSEARGADRVEAMLKATTRVPQLRAVLQPALLEMPSRELVRAMIRGSDNNVRRMAASVLAAVAAKRKGVTREVIRAVRFSRRAAAPPWGKQALFIPGLRWEKSEARQLVGQLLRWHLWADIRGDESTQLQIHNNLRSNQLAAAGQYTSPGWRAASTLQWLKVWSDAVGEAAVYQMLREQRVASDRRYRSIF